jgi:Domain of unknown function (DUF4262)
MCAQWEDGSRESDLDEAARIAAEQGWFVQGVEPGGTRPLWAYTVGLTAFDRPELVATGMTLDEAADLLDGVAAHLAHDLAPPPGRQVPLVGGPLIEFVAVPHPEVHLDVAVAVYGHRVWALQVVWADRRERWPWDPDFRSGRGGQPVLGPRAQP